MVASDDEGCSHEIDDNSISYHIKYIIKHAYLAYFGLFMLL